MCDVKEITTGHVLCAEGEMSDEVFLIVTGTVRVSQKDREDGLEVRALRGPPPPPPPTQDA